MRSIGSLQRKKRVLKRVMEVCSVELYSSGRKPAQEYIMEPDLQFDQQGLLPVVTVDDKTGEVLMLAFMSRESLQLTRETGEVHYFSRSRNTLWHKGEQSGNVQEVKGIFINCEQNSLLIRVIQRGDAACHEGYHSCYYRRLQPDGTFETIAER